MWIFDSYFKGCVELWSREGGLSRAIITYPPSFYLHLKDRHDHWEDHRHLQGVAHADQGTG